MRKIIIGVFVIMMLFISVIPITNSININSMVPDLVFSPSYHNFGYVEEGDTYQTTFDIWNGGTDVLTWNLGIVHTWISPFPVSGSSTGEHDTVTVTIDTTGLSSGSHSGFVSISANDGGGMRYFNIDLSINDPPNTPSQLSGPSSGFVSENLYYTSSTTDPNGDDIKYGLDVDNDGVVDKCTDDYYSSGTTITFIIRIHYPGTFHLRLKAQDEHGAESGWSTPKTVLIIDNNPPSKPVITGPSTGISSTSYTFNTSSLDPDDDDIKYGWDWDGDDTVDEWSVFYNSSDTCSMSHTWITTGIYNIKVKAQDEHGADSDWSNPKTMVIGENNPPLKPVITGPSSGKAGNSYTYYVSTIDPDEDQLYYWIDWDDGTNSGWLGPFISGLSTSSSHIWTAEGTYSIKVKAKDIHGTESLWSDPLSISMPKLKKFDLNYFSIMKFFENHGILNNLFNRLKT